MLPACLSLNHIRNCLTSKADGIFAYAIRRIGSNKGTWAFVRFGQNDLRWVSFHGICGAKILARVERKRGFGLPPWGMLNGACIVSRINLGLTCAGANWAYFALSRYVEGQLDTSSQLPYQNYPWFPRIDTM